MSGAYVISPNAPYLTQIVKGVLQRFDISDPIKARQCTIITPTIASANTLKSAFGIVSGKAVFAPSIIPIRQLKNAWFWDLEIEFLERIESKNIIYKSEQKKWLVKEIIEYGWMDNLRADSVVNLADNMIDVWNELFNANINIQELDNYLPEEISDFWKESYDIITQLHIKWQKYCDDNNLIDENNYHNQLLTYLAYYISSHEIKFPIILVGSTGSQVATSRLIKSLYQAHNGYYIMPLCDVRLLALQPLLEPTNPQYALQQQMRALEIEFKSWYGDIEYHHHAFDWFNKPEIDPLDNIKSYIYETELDELRHAAIRIVDIEHQYPKSDQMIICEDRSMALQLHQLLGRFGIVAHDSAGFPAINSPDVVILLHLVRLLAKPEIHVSDIVALLLLPEICYKDAREIAGKLLMGEMDKSPRRDVGILDFDIFEEFNHEYDDIKSFVDDLIKLIKIFYGKDSYLINNIISDVVGFSFGTFDAESLPDLFRRIANNYSCKSCANGSNIKITGLIDTRLITADYIFVIGMTDKSYPASSNNIWLNDALREALGLENSAALRGLSAHDFQSLLTSDNVILSHAKTKLDGSLNSPSSLLAPYGYVEDKEIKDWHDQIFVEAEKAGKEGSEKPIANPDISARVKEFSPSAIEQLIHDPYGFYARYILKLQPFIIDRMGLGENQLFGIFIHELIELWLKESPSKMRRDEAYETWHKIANQIIPDYLEKNREQNLWLIQIDEIFEFMLQYEYDNANHRSQLLLEEKGEIELNINGKKVILFCYADRIELMQDGVMHIIDYKSFTSLPSANDIKNGKKPQLMIEKIIAENGGFENLKNYESDILRYLSTARYNSGNRAPTGLASVKYDYTEIKESIFKMIASYITNEPFVASEDGEEFTSKKYAHLARKEEWS